MQSPSQAAKLLKPGRPRPEETILFLFSLAWELKHLNFLVLRQHLDIHLHRHQTSR